MTVHSRDRPAYWRRAAGMVTRPCLSGTSSDGQEHAGVVAGGLAGGGACLHLGGETHELVHGEDVEAALLASGDDEALSEAVAELGGEEEPALLVEPRGCGSRETRRSPPFWRLQSTPPASCAPHFTPPYPQRAPITVYFYADFRLFLQVRRGGAKWSDFPVPGR